MHISYQEKTTQNQLNSCMQVFGSEDFLQQTQKARIICSAKRRMQTGPAISARSGTHSHRSCTRSGNYRNMTNYDHFMYKCTYTCMNHTFLGVISSPFHLLMSCFILSVARINISQLCELWLLLSSSDCYCTSLQSHIISEEAGKHNCSHFPPGIWEYRG